MGHRSRPSWGSLSRRRASQGQQEMVPACRGVIRQRPSVQESEEANQDDLLDDVRKSLLEEEAQEEGKDQKWWRRFGKSSRPKSAEAGDARSRRRRSICLH